jgi:hypothetical protein
MIKRSMLRVWVFARRRDLSGNDLMTERIAYCMQEIGPLVPKPIL